MLVSSSSPAQALPKAARVFLVTRHNLLCSTVPRRRRAQVAEVANVFVQLTPKGFGSTKTISILAQAREIIRSASMSVNGPSPATAAGCESLAPGPVSVLTSGDDMRRAMRTARPHVCGMGALVK